MSTIKVDTVRPVTTNGSLTLQGDSSGSGVSGITIDSSGNTTLGGNLVIPDDGTIGSANDTDAITIDSSGNVGVGTTTALSKLTALGASSTVTNAASTRSPVASLRGGNNNNRLDFYVDNTGATSIMGLGAYNTVGGSTAMAFYTGASVDERMRIDNSGHVIVPNGVTLGTAAGTYAAANTLDDYEEGTWTPTGNVVTFTSVEGNYIKIGKLVHVEGFVVFPSTSDTSIARIQNFPFEIANYGGLAIGFENFSGSQISILCQPSSYAVTFRDGSTKTNADLSGREFYFGGTYIAS